MKVKLKYSIWLVPAVIGGLIAVCLLVVVLRGKPPIEPPAMRLANLEVTTLQPREYHEKLELPARIVAEREVLLSAESGGRIDRWMVAEGARVVTGEVLAVVNDDELRAGLAEAEARRDAALAGVDAAEKRQAASRAALVQSRTAVSAAKLSLTASEADFDFRRKEYARIKRLFDDEIVSESTLDGATNDLTQARLRVDAAHEEVARAEQAVASAEANLGSAAAAVSLAESQALEMAKSVELFEVKLEKTRVKAPFAGQVDKRLVEVGGWVAHGTPLIRLYDFSRVRAVIDVSDRYVPFLDLGNQSVARYLQMTLPDAEQSISASIILPGMPKLTGGVHGGLELSAEIVRIGQAADPLSNTFEVELGLDNPGGALKQGMLVKTRLVFLLYREALVVPLRALNITDAGIRVLVVEEQNGISHARIRSVSPVSIDGEKVLVDGDLRPGDRMVVAGGRGVVDGEQVNMLVVDGVVVE